MIQKLPTSRKWHIHLQSFVDKVHKELEAANSDSAAVTRSKMTAKCPNTIRTPKFVDKLQSTFNKNFKKSVNAIAKELKVSRNFIARIVHENFYTHHT